MAVFLQPDEAHVRALLASCKLPDGDLTPAHFEHFFGWGERSHPSGVAGVELLGEVGLLRSLAVHEEARGEGQGHQLVSAVEAHARSEGVRALYLLTTDAQAYFLRHGYRPVERADAPAAVRATTQFSSVCCSSATLMMKSLD